MKPAPQVAIALTVILLAACRSKEIHLYDAEGYGPNTAEISIKGDTGMAYWRWGEKTFAMKVTLVKDELIHSDRDDGVLDLKMADGTRLSFTRTQGRLICFQGCGNARLPHNWLSRGDD